VDEEAGSQVSRVCACGDGGVPGLGQARACHLAWYGKEPTLSVVNGELANVDACMCGCHSHPCPDFAPATWTAHWRDWHRGHGCVLDPDRKPRIPGKLDADSLRSRIERAQPKPVRLSGPERPHNMPEQDQYSDPTTYLRQQKARDQAEASSRAGGITAKLAAQSVTIEASTPNNYERVKLTAVTADSPVNKTWSKYTPAGSLELQITNPGAQGFILAGKEYIVSIRLAEPGE
jgi:hypothetical protein